MQSYYDYSLFSFTKGDKEVRVLVYVDDLILATNSMEILSQFKSYLSQCFKMKDLGKLRYFLGIEVARSEEGMVLSQRKYTLDLIADVGLNNARPAATPVEQNHNLAADKSPLMPDPKQYRRLVGRLVYLANTRPELCYAIHLLSQFMKAPREDHWHAAIRVVKFLKGCPGQGILLSSNPDLEVSLYVDADWSNCRTSRRSLSAYVVFLGGSPVCWKTKKQKTVSLSSAEAEYRAMGSATKEAKWVINISKGLSQCS